jgi:hypothetical protein
MANGMQIRGKPVQVPGVRILSPLEENWNYLSKYNTRTKRPQFKILHKTVADDPELVVETPPESKYQRFWGYAQLTLEWWHKPGTDPKTGKPNPPLSGTHLVTGHNGDTVCPADLYSVVGWHANQANELSWGHEIKEYVGGRVHRAALSAAVAITLVDTSEMGVQWQCPRSFSRPLARFRNGGRDLVGVFGHRDVTSSRNRHDPGDKVFAMLEHAGFERFDFGAGEDLEVWRGRQEQLKDRGFYHGAIDGIAGAGTTAACAAAGFPAGIWARGRELAEWPLG